MKPLWQRPVEFPARMSDVKLKEAESGQMGSTVKVALDHLSDRCSPPAAPGTQTESVKQAGLSVFLLGCLTGLGFTAALFCVVLKTGLLAADFSAESKRIRKGLTTIATGVDERRALLLDVVAALEAERISKGTYPQTPNRGFAKLADVLPAFGQRAASILQRGETPIRLRIVGEGYKVVFSHATCMGARLTRPEMVDPVRDRYQGYCLFYGLWNDAGKGL